METSQVQTRHRPLARDEIRIVTLLPGNLTDPVVCTLVHINLGDAQGAPYEAVSYAWGDVAETRSITLDDCPYPVTLNLFSALAYIRNHTDPTRLWVDSLCINQQDLAERSAQVARMRDIFASAAQVNVWLGDYGGYPKSDWHLAFQYMLACSHWNTQPPKKATEQHRMNTVEERHAKGRDLMTGLLGRAWFTRAWVVQEVAVRHWQDDGEKVKLLVGHLSAPWFVMSTAFGHLLYIRASREDGTLWDSYNQQNGLCSIAKAWKYKNLLTQLAREKKYVGFAEQLAMYLSRFTQFGTTDQRDRVYSLLGLLVGNDTVPEYPVPDYSKPVSVVLHEYTAWMLKEGTCIDILGLSSGPQPDRPSWVPDFVGRRGVFYRNLDDTNPARLLDGDRLLEIEALPITVVVAAGPRCHIRDESKRKTHPPAASEVDDCRRYILACEALLTKLVPKKTPESAATESKLRRIKDWAKRASGLPETVPKMPIADTPRKRLCKYFDDTFSASLMDSHWTTPLPREQLHDLLMTEQAHAKGPESPAVLAQPYGRYIADEFNEYTFFTCENGEMDFCRSTSAAPQPGDMLCLLRGSTSRYILRPVDQMEQWTLVGTAYMDAKFSRAWHRHGESEESRMRESWATMWKENQERGNVMRVVIR